jgi:putative tryptophan/tyrosine transport system substrate-binding protein
MLKRRRWRSPDGISPESNGTRSEVADRTSNRRDCAEGDIAGIEIPRRSGSCHSYGVLSLLAEARGPRPVKRRNFITLLGGAVAAWPLAARAQQPSIPVVGWLGATTAEAAKIQVEAFRRGLSETGFVDGHSVKIEYRWAENRYAQLPALAADLVSRKVDAIVASGGSVGALAAKTATATIPIVFASVGADPIKVGLVPSLNRPGGNVTGNTIFSNELNAKKLEILHGLVPATAAIALLVNPDGPTANSVVQDTQEAAHALGRRLLVVRASNEREIDTAWADVVEQGAGGLIVAPDGFFGARRDQLVSLAARHRIPVMHESRSFADAGGFISYGADNLEGHRLAGIYVGRILKGAKAADLPVLQPAKFYLVVNLKTAKAFGITIPDALLIQATELIE